MSARKATSKPKSSPAAKASRPRHRFAEGQGRYVALGVLVAALFFGSWYTVWSGVREHVLSSESYWLTPNHVEITALPRWIHTDIRAEVFRDASLDGPLSILDDDLVSRIAQAFSLHPWVAKVRRVTKHHPALVRVELEYRRPVCMVQVAGGLLPVDTEGVVLPSGDFSPVEAARYPRLTGTDTVPLGPVGTRWGDPRVVGAAAIAAALDADWQTMGLERIVAAAPSAPARLDQSTFDLFTRSGTRILWGRSPDDELGGEPSAAEKAAALRQYAREHGTLDGPHGPQQFDLRMLRPTESGQAQ